MIDDFDELGATIERPIANAHDAIANRYARQATATIERLIANARDAVGYNEIRQRFILDSRNRTGR